MENSNLKFMGNSSYAGPVYTLNENERLSEFDDGMIMNNAIKGIIGYVYEQTGKERTITYNEVKGTSLALLRSHLGKQHFISVLSAISDVLIVAENYMLVETNFVFDEKYIFIDTNTYSASLVYIPVENYNGKTFVQFIKEFITNGVFDLSENADYRMRILNVINSDPHISAKDIKKFLQSMLVNSPASALQETPTPRVNKDNNPHRTPEKSSSVPPINNIPSKPDIPPQKHKLFSDFGKKKKNKQDTPSVNQSSQKGIMAGMAIPGEENVVSKNNVPINAPVTPTPQEKNVNNTVHPPKKAVPTETAENVRVEEYEESPHTILIGAGASVTGNTVGCLVSASGQKIKINKPNFMIGKKSRDGIPNDYDINNPAVSRQHAVFIKRGSVYYLVDSGSLNGTYVNDERIQTKAEIELHDGDKIVFANEIFKFVIVRE